MDRYLLHSAACVLDAGCPVTSNLTILSVSFDQLCAGGLIFTLLTTVSVFISNVNEV